MEPGKTSFFQALGVPTKIARGTIEITSDLKLVEAGAKVGASEATLLNMLNISPFTYGMKVVQVYEEGNTFSPDVLDIEESQLLKAMASAIATVTAISLAANYPTLPSVIHSLVNGYKKAISAAIPIDYEWDAIHELKDRIANPDSYASSAPAAASADTSAAPAAAKEEEKEEEKEESEDEGMRHPNPPNKRILLTVPQASAVSSTKHPLRHHALDNNHDTFNAVTETSTKPTNEMKISLQPITFPPRKIQFPTFFSFLLLPSQSTYPRSCSPDRFSSYHHQSSQPAQLNPTCKSTSPSYRTCTTLQLE